MQVSLLKNEPVLKFFNFCQEAGVALLDNGEEDDNVSLNIFYCPQ